jgi:hypothetical protein|tara:strand:- start:121 stop:561 length:441 start_codon:yes stop_codon:yes gene_type:complete
MMIDYEAFIDTIDRFCMKTGCPTFKQTWHYTKLMIYGHGVGTRFETEEHKEMMQRAWQEFEHTIDQDYERGHVGLKGVVENFLESVPTGMGLMFLINLEIAINRGRGYTLQESKDHVYEHYREILDLKSKRKSHLKLVEDEDFEGH